MKSQFRFKTIALRTKLGVGMQEGYKLQSHDQLFLINLNIALSLVDTKPNQANFECLTYFYCISHTW